MDSQLGELFMVNVMDDFTVPGFWQQLSELFTNQLMSNAALRPDKAALQ